MSSTLISSAMPKSPQTNIDQSIDSTDSYQELCRTATRSADQTNDTSSSWTTQSDDPAAGLSPSRRRPQASRSVDTPTRTHDNTSRFVWLLGGAVVRALDLRLAVAGPIPAAALSSATLDKLFIHTVLRL